MQVMTGGGGAYRLGCRYLLLRLLPHTRGAALGGFLRLALRHHPHLLHPPPCPWTGVCRNHHHTQQQQQQQACQTYVSHTTIIIVAGQPLEYSCTYGPTTAVLVASAEAQLS